MEQNHIKEFADCNTLSASVFTTGHMGGDSGHGGHTSFSLTDEDSTDMSVSYVTEEGMAVNNIKVKKVSIDVRGDSELDTLTGALTFITNYLSQYATKHKDDEMEIKTIRELKRQIKNLVVKFENDTLLKVTGISFDHSWSLESEIDIQA